MSLRSIHIQIVRCNYIPRIVPLYFLHHLFFTSGLEAGGGMRLVAARVGAMSQYEQAGLARLAMSASSRVEVWYARRCACQWGEMRLKLARV